MFRSPVTGLMVVDLGRVVTSEDVADVEDDGWWSGHRKRTSHSAHEHMHPSLYGPANRGRLVTRDPGLAAHHTDVMDLISS